MIAKKTWIELRGMGLAYQLLLILQLLPAVLLWPDLRRGGSALTNMMPAEFLKDIFRQVMQDDADPAYLAYMAVQLFFKGVNIVGIAAAVLVGTGLIARERENQTLEFLLSRPVSRSAVLWNKFWVAALIVTIPIFLGNLVAVPLSLIPSVDQDLPIDRVLLGSFHNAAFCLLVLALTTLFSIFARAQVHAAFWIGALVISQVAIYFIQEIRVASLFRLSDFDIYGPIMSGSASFGYVFEHYTLWVLLGALAVYIAADRLFQRIRP